MLGNQLTKLLQDTPPGIEQTLALVTDFDDILIHGFARLTEEHTATLNALAAAVAATPLGERVGEVVAKLSTGSPDSEQLALLAGTRAALLGAVHDALLSHLDTILNRSRAAHDESAASPSPDPEAENLLTGCRSWLHELAITGWRGVDHELVASASQLIGPLLANPKLRRMAVLIDGFAAELSACCPIRTADHIPVRRWADLWTRAMLLSYTGGWSADDSAGLDTVSGRLLILGADVHEHGTAMQVQVHGVLEPTDDSTPRLVRTSVAVAKVDTIIGPAMWDLLQAYPVLMTALAERRSIHITDLPALPSGDLVWNEERAKVGAPADPFTTARIQLASALAPAVPALDRHPVQIAEPVLMEGYKVKRGEDLSVIVDGVSLPIAVDRLPSCGPLTPQLVDASSACIGLLRWDSGQWALQPLAVQSNKSKKTQVAVHNGDWAKGPTDPKVAKAQTRNGDAIAVLRERAGRLLRR